MDAVKNFAKVTVDGIVESVDTEITLQTGHGDRLPATPFNMVLWNATDYPDPADDPIVEIVRVTDNTSDVLTVTRAQEGTAAEDHNEAGKTYKMIAGMTARTMSEDLLGDVFGSGPAILVVPETPDITLRIDGSAKMLDLTDSYAEIQHSVVRLGDVEGQGNSAYINVDDPSSKVTLTNLDLATTQSQSATVAVGVLAGKLAIYNGSGTLIGYIPIYATII